MKYRIFLCLLFDVRLLHGMSLSADRLQRQSETRAGRERAIRDFNSIASELGVPQLASGPVEGLAQPGLRRNVHCQAS